jgi:tetratricopeptide (TPR) repeat protein
MRVHALSLALGCLLLASGIARAQEADGDADVDAGRSHFKAGVDYYRDGDLTTALIEFKRAYAAAPNYRLLYNLGQVSHELRDYTEAQGYFQRYLREGGDEIDPARKREVEAALAKIAGRIATVVVSSNLSGAEIFVDDVSVGKSPMGEPVRVSAGTRRISAAISGRQRVTQVIEAAGGDTLVVKLEFAPAARPEANVAHGDAAKPAASSSGPSPALWLGIGTGVLAAGAGVMAILAAGDAAEYHDAIDRKTTAAELDALHDSATTKALVTDILLGATLVGAAVTVWVAVDSGSDDEREPTARLSLGAGSVALSGRFQ